MRALFDTQLLIWAAFGSNRLPEKVRTLLLDKDLEAVFSAASVWEVTIKSSLGKPGFAVDPAGFHEGLVGAGYVELPITARHTVAVGALPDHHRDPFDRVLVAQALTENIEFVTADRTLDAYPGAIRVV